MNMMMLMNSLLSELTPGTQEMSKPAERGITAATMALRNFNDRSSSGNRLTLCHSTIRNHTSEAATRIAVVTNVSLVCSDQCLGL